MLIISGSKIALHGDATGDANVVKLGIDVYNVGKGVKILKIAKNIEDIITTTVGIIDDINKGTFSINSFNLIRNKLKLNLNKLNKDLDKLYAMM